MLHHFSLKGQDDDKPLKKRLQSGRRTAPRVICVMDEEGKPASNYIVFDGCVVDVCSASTTVALITLMGMLLCLRGWIPENILSSFGTMPDLPDTGFSLRRPPNDRIHEVSREIVQKVQVLNIITLCYHFPLYHFGGFIQKRHNSIANALELCLFCIKPLLPSYFRKHNHW